MKKKMMLTVLMVLLVVSSLLAACSNNGGSSQGNNGGSQTKPPGEQGSGGAKEGANEKISILLSHSAAEYAQQMKKNDPYVAELSKQSGYDLDFEFLGHGDDFVQQLTVRFASKDLPDLIRTDSINSTMHPGALDGGVFHDLTDLIEQYGPNLKKNIPEAAWDSPRVQQDGKIYGIPTLSALPASRVVYIRKDWLDKLEMDVPKTIDDFLAYFEAVKNNDLNGNGDPNDEYGLYVRENLIYSDLFFRDFGAHPGQWYYRDGELKPGMVLPETKDAIAFWKELYDNEYINPNLFTNANNDWLAGIYQGKGGMWVHDITNLVSSWAPHNFLDENNQVIPIAPSAGLSPQGEQIYFVWVIPSSVKNPEKVIQFLDWAWSEESDDFFNFGIEGVTYEKQGDDIVWDPDSEANAENGASLFYQLSINMRGDGRMHPDVVANRTEGEVLAEGVDIAANAMVENDGLYMPNLKSLATKPELAPGTGAGTLFLDMFAKVITGQEDLDTAYDKFVDEWYRRGGNEIVKEATEWYHDFHNN